MMSYNLQSNFLAKLLSNKLDNLDINTNLSMSANIDAKLRNASNDNTRPCPDKYGWILDNGIGSCDWPEPSKMSQNCPFLGTTFPPNKFISCDLVRAKFQKESVLLRQVQKRNKKVLEMEIPSRPNDIPRDVRSADSELFFDFDIGSPEKHETDNYVTHDEDDMDLDHLSFSFSGSDNPLMNYSRSLNSPADSITYQSTSSGLFSQPYSPSPTEKENLSGLDELDEKTLFPEEWFKNHFSNCDDPTPKVQSPALSSQDLSYNYEMNHSPEQESNLVKIPVWNGEMTVASDKLEALLTQLQSDSEPLKAGRLIHSSKSYSTSPANFSYLKGSMYSDKVSDDKNDEIKTIAKSFSLYEMSDYEKSTFSEASPIGESETASAEIGASCEDLNEKYRKCSSLRSGKTPPSTPRGMKIVRFADIFGLDLADVKTFFDEIPKVPRSAFKDLKDADISDLESDSGSEIPPSIDYLQDREFSAFSGNCQTSPALAPLFNQPGGSSEFFNVLRDKRVCLENASVANHESIKGIVRVVNLDFNKKVVIRYSFDDWITSTDIQATYVQGSCDGFSDKFTFSFDYKQISGMVGKRLHFCIKYECLGFEYWDSNQGRNYTFQMFGPTTTPPLKSVDESIPIVSRMSNRRSFGRRSSPVNSRPVTNTATTHFETFSHSPSTTDDPWLRY